MKYLSAQNLNQNQLQNAVIHPLASAPSSPVAGQVYFDTTLNEFGYWNGSAWEYPGSSTASVSSVTVESANGFAGTVADSTSTPQITLTTTISGMVKAAGSALVAATAGTDYLTPTGSGASLTGITVSQVSGAAPTASPALTGTPTAPTATAGTNTTQLATTAFVTAATAAASQGLDPKASAVVVSTSNQSTLSGLLTIDGVTLTAGQRVLLTGQTTASQNGLWAAASGSWSRTADFATGSTQNGTYVFIESGTAGNGSGWVMTGAGNVTVDTTSETWVQFSGAGELIAGTGLTKTGNTLSLTSLIGKYATTVGNGSSTSITVTHNLGSQDVHTQVYDATAYTVVECDITNATTNTVTLGFSTAPASNAYRVVVIG